MDHKDIRLVRHGHLECKQCNKCKRLHYSSQLVMVVVVGLLLQCALLVSPFAIEEQRGSANHSRGSAPLQQFNSTQVPSVSNNQSFSGSGSDVSDVIPQCESGANVTCDDTHQHHVEQILMDIFDDDDEEGEEEHVDDEGQEQQSSDQLRSDDEDDELDEQDDATPALQHTVSKRSADTTESSSEELTPSRSGRTHGRKKQKKSNHPHSTSPRRSRRPSRTHKKSTKNVNKYNDYMDVVLKRMNSMIKTKQMDPLMVNLFSGGSNKDTENKQPQKKGKKKSQGKKKRKGAKNRGRSEDIDEEEEMEDLEEDEMVLVRSEAASDSDEVELDNDHDNKEEGLARSFRTIRALIINGSMMKRSAGGDSSNYTSKAVAPTETRGFDRPTTTTTTTTAADEESPRKHSSGSKKNKSKQKETKSKSQKNKNSKTKQKNKKKQKKQKPTRGVLKGLSSLRRSGNVDVIRQGDKVRIVRSKFLLGPVTLEIVPKGAPANKLNEEERANKKKSKVTAVASQLKGIIEVRLKKNSPTTIKRLRVFPPSSVKIKSSSSSTTTTGSGKKTHSSSSGGSSVPRYSKVTPVATHRLRQIATAVVRQADVRRKTSALPVDDKTIKKKQAL